MDNGYSEVLKLSLIAVTIGLVSSAVVIMPLLFSSDHPPSVASATSLSSSSIFQRVAGSKYQSMVSWFMTALSTSPSSDLLVVEYSLYNLMSFRRMDTLQQVEVEVNLLEDEVPLVFSPFSFLVDMVFY